MVFQVRTDGREQLGLRALCEQYAGNLWVPAHYSPQQAAEFVRDQFRRALAVELDRLEIVPQDAVA